MHPDDQSAMKRLLNQKPIVPPRQDSLTSSINAVNTPISESANHKKTSIRLNPEIDAFVRGLCYEYNLPRDCLIEALCLYLQAHPKALEFVLGQAKVIADERKLQGDKRRAIAYQKKYLS